MFFEGSEKKLEIVVSPSVGSLREWGKPYWQEVVAASGAQILSSISSDCLDAYLLSESSLFVWEDRLTMITCGSTTLVGAVEKILERITAEDIDVLVFERKNEYFPHRQHSDFFSDIDRLTKLVDGKAFRFGDANEHHLFLFHTNKNYDPRESDKTIEILMYGLRGEAKEAFSCPSGKERKTIQSMMDRTSLFKGFEIDDFVFKPCGYSLNAVRGEEYFTIHVTPQEISPYVSFETSIEFGDGYDELVAAVIGTFQPKSFDLVQFQTEEPTFLNIPEYQCRDQVKEDLNCGYHVGFSTHGLPRDKVEKAFPVTALK